MKYPAQILIVSATTFILNMKPKRDKIELLWYIIDKKSVVNNAISFEMIELFKESV